MAPRHLLALLAATASGCATPDITHCGDGRVCGLGTICTPSGCASPGCGDGDVDSFNGEQCDDGNLIVGDGCSASCTLEVCGNGVRDSENSEECDDGNRLSRDGCSSMCLEETATWHVLVTPGSPVTAVDAVAAWDPDRGRAMMHGGQRGATRIDEVWSFDGTWHREPAGPPALAGHTIAWDGAGSLVVFGDSPASDVCWVWSGTWMPCSGPLPPARTGHAMSTAPGGGVVMIGGSAQPDQTWLWNGGTWQNAGLPAPAQLAIGAMARDRARGFAALVGLDLVGAGRTWLFSNTGWAPLPAELPVAQSAATYDPDRRRVVVYGGVSFGGVPSDELVQLDADRWSHIDATPRPRERAKPVFFHDSIRRGLVLFGGAGIGADDRTWILRWDSATPDELCADAMIDTDGDALAGCADPDCWGRCDPRCPPAHTDCDPSRPRCGDNVCNPWLETAALCPEDCP